MVWRAAVNAAAFACAVAAPVAAVLAAPLSFKLENASGYALTEVYVSPSLEDKWGRDLLHAKPLAHGAAADIAVAGRDETCHYDIRMVGDDGSLVEAVAIDLCTIERYTLEP